MIHSGPHQSALNRYGLASDRAAGQIIRSYSTSFGVATTLLGKRHRQHVRNIYALVRIADELVDGVATEAHITNQEQYRKLDALEDETHRAIQEGFSTNPVVHAFATSARYAGFGSELTEPFFASMRKDLKQVPLTGPDPEESGPAPLTVMGFDSTAHRDYVYGSAEVIGLMCLRIFLAPVRRSAAEVRQLERGARSLAAAFQNVNFLRDLADDLDRLQRSYLSEGEPMTEKMKRQWVSSISAQLAEAKTTLPLLPGDARVAVDCTRRLFTALTEKIAGTPVEQLLQRRIRVSNSAKTILIAQSLAQRVKGRFI